MSWKKRASGEAAIDFETVEVIISDMLDAFDTKQIDFTKQFKVSFNCSLDEDGCVVIDEFGFAGDDLRNESAAEPLVEIMEFKGEILAVVDATNLPEKNVDFKISEKALSIFARNSTRQLKKVGFPCRVQEESIRTSYNNGVLEIRLSKKKTAEKKVLRAK